MTRTPFITPLLVLAACGLAAPAAAAPETIRIGALATLQGTYAALGQDGMRGLELAIAERNGTVAGKTIALVKASTDITPDTAVQMARKLVEQDKVDIVIGPLSGGEGIAVKDYARTRPNVTFLYGSAASEVTSVNPAPNYYRFSTDGAQWMAGLGRYAHDVKKYGKVVTIAEDYSFPYSQVAGFMHEFCRAGGRVPNKIWVPIGQKDFSSVVAAIPADTDALYVALVGSDAVNFLTQYAQAGGEKPIIGGSFSVDQTTLAARGPFRKLMVGTPAAGPIASALEDPAWTRFVAAFKARYPKEEPGIIAHAYYVNALGLFAGLEAVQGDLSDGQKRLQAALASIRIDTPTGPVSLDGNRQAIADSFVTEVMQRPDGTLGTRIVARATAVPQTLGLPAEEYRKLGPASRDNPSCP